MTLHRQSLILTENCPIRDVLDRLGDRWTVLVLRDVPPGPYGVSVMHDRNANGKLDSNIVGIPT